MSHDASDRFSRGDDPLLRVLARSARLDRPEHDARTRVLERVLADVPAPRRPARSAVALGASLGLAATAAAAYLAVLRPRAEAPPPRLGPETPLLEPAPNAGARAPASVPSAPAPPVPVLPACPRIAAAAGNEPLVDDFEDGNARLFLAEGRAGTWRVNAPPGTKVSPAAGTLAFPVTIPGGRGDSRKALRLSAAQFRQGGAGLVADLAAQSCYDASAYGGVEFFARGTARLSFRVTLIDAMEKRWGGLCDENCYDAHERAVVLGASFARYRIRWDELAQSGWGRALPFDARRIFLLDFMVDAADSPFEVWIDDVRFLPR